MNLLIRMSPDGTRAAVSATIATTAPGGTHLLRPGETYREVPYRVWRSYVDQEVDALSLRHSAGNPGAASMGVSQTSPFDPRGGPIMHPPSLSRCIRQGIIVFGVPYAILTAVVREIGAPGPGFDTGRFATLLMIKLLVGIVFLGPLMGLFLWRRTRADSTT